MSYQIMAGLATFALVFLRGFQQKNVHGNHYLAAFGTSYCQAVADVLVIYYVAKHGWEIFPYTSTGAAFGIVSAMWLHNRTFNKKVKQDVEEYGQ